MTPIFIVFFTLHFGTFIDWGTIKPRDNWYRCSRCNISHECMGTEGSMCQKCHIGNALGTDDFATHCNSCDLCFAKRSSHCKSFGTCMSKNGYLLYVIYTVSQLFLCILDWIWNGCLILNMDFIGTILVYIRKFQAMYERIIFFWFPDK